MRSLTLVAMLIAAGGCTQDFGAFDPVATTGAGGAGIGGAGAGPSGGGGAGATGATGGAGAIGGMPGGFGGTGDEDCENAVDDDADGDTDCADSDCTPLFDCAPEVPAGWTGPVALAEAAATTPCDGAYTMLEIAAFADLQFDPAVCSACGCEDAAVNCVSGSIQPYDEAACTGPLGGAITQGNPCNTNDSPAGTDGVIIQAPVATANGDCNETGGQPTLGGVTWQTTGTVCSTTFTPGAGCTTGEVCVPKTPAGFGLAQCVSQTGDQACPAGYPTKNLYNATIDDFVDTRDCGACTCGAPAATCEGATTFYSQNNCNGTPTEVIDNDGTCGVVNGWSARQFSVTDSAAPCAPAGGGPNGTVVPGNDVVTVCCSG